MTNEIAFRLRLTAAFLLVSAPLIGQSSGIDLSYGYWWTDQGTSVLKATYQHRLVGPFDYGIGLIHLRSLTQTEDLRQTGGEVSLALGRVRTGPYALGTVGMAMGHADGNVTAIWSAGLGWSVQPIRFLNLGLEGRYQVEDSQIHGFWRLHPDDFRGLTLQARVVVNLGGPGAGGSVGTPQPQPEYRPPPEDEIRTAATGDGASAEASQLRTQVVETALGAMGAPYRWGGSDSNGFDCSGLIQYSYEAHGLILPRISRDQARTGMRVDLDIASLLPGDILGFTGERSGVGHVGLYVGDGMFIHSATDGVKLSSLRGDASSDRWWAQRWVSARRVIN
ncbi:MAG: C40 family peptidase [Gemmatimonadota bacterium]|nr:MAG: C40 family peptidase [Gemmatimonadota bacterium]